MPCHDIVSQIVFTENGAAVDSVMIGGRMVLDHGRLTTIDEKKLRRDACAAAERLFAVNTPMRSFAKELAGALSASSVIGSLASPITFTGWLRRGDERHMRPRGASALRAISITGPGFSLDGTRTMRDHSL